MNKVILLTAALMILNLAFGQSINEANRFFKEKQFAEAEAEFRKTLPELKGTAKADAQLYLGHSLYQQKKYDEAISEFRKVSDIERAAPAHISDANKQIERLLKIQGGKAQ